MMEKNKAIADILHLMTENNLNINDISNALNKDIAPELNHSNTILSSLLSKVGTILFLCGLSLFVSMQWAHISPLMRTFLTLGIGELLYIYAFALNTQDSQPNKLSQSLLLVASLLIPTGFMVMLHEQLEVNKFTHLIILSALSVGLLQFVTMFLYRKSAELWFILLVYYSMFIAVLLDYFNISMDLNGLITGVSLMLITYSVNHSDTLNKQSPFWYFISSVAIYCFASSLFLYSVQYEIFYLAVIVLGTLVSIKIPSRIILIVSLMASLQFIYYISMKYFVSSSGWPIMLIILGLFCWSLSQGALYLNRTYISKRDQKNIKG